MGSAVASLPCINVEIVKSGPTLSLHQQQGLVAEVTHDKIRKALYSLPNDKEPGIDGYQVEFFKANWNIVRDDVCSAVQAFFKSGKLLI